MLKRVARATPGLSQRLEHKDGIRRASTWQRHRSNLLRQVTPWLPRFLQPSTWSAIVPSSLRQSTRDLLAQNRKKPINPATYFIWIYILIGSQAIRILQVKNDHATYSRKADLQIGKLREVVRKLQAGEEVDVEKVLGTGVQEEEDAWEEALRDIEREEMIWSESKRQKRERKELEKEKRKLEEQERGDANPVSQISTDQNNSLAEVKNVSNTDHPLFVKPSFY